MTDLINLNILIGTACNLKCKYCMQSMSNNDDINKKHNIPEFVLKLKEFLKSKNLTEIRQIQIWGGEPLVYFNNVRVLIAELEKQLDFKRLRICTNGTLISEEYVAFVNAHEKIYTTISCHGFNFSDDQLKLMMKINSIRFTELITHQRRDLSEIRRWFYRIYNLTNILPCFDFGLVYSTPECSSEYRLTADDICIFYNNMTHVLEDAINGDIFSIMSARNFVNDVDHYRKIRLRGKCSYKTLSVDQKGNIYGFCHHNFSKNNIIDSIDNKNVIKIFKDSGIQSKCDSCESGCIFICPLEEDQELMCYKNRIIILLYDVFSIVVRNDFKL